MKYNYRVVKKDSQGKTIHCFKCKGQITFQGSIEVPPFCMWCGSKLNNEFNKKNPRWKCRSNPIPFTMCQVQTYQYNKWLTHFRWWGSELCGQKPPRYDAFKDLLRVNLKSCPIRVKITYEDKPEKIVKIR